MVLTSVPSHPPTVVFCVLHAVLVVFPLLRLCTCSVRWYEGTRVTRRLCFAVLATRDLVFVSPFDPCHGAYTNLWSVLGVWSLLQVI